MLARLRSSSHTYKKRQFTRSSNVLVPSASSDILFLLKTWPAVQKPRRSTRSGMKCPFTSSSSRSSSSSETSSFMCCGLLNCAIEPGYSTGPSGPESTPFISSPRLQLFTLDILIRTSTILQNCHLRLQGSRGV